MKCILDSMNKTEVRFKSENHTTASKKTGYDEYTDVDVPVASVTIRRSQWEQMGRPNEVHIEDYTGR